MAADGCPSSRSRRSPCARRCRAFARRIGPCRSIRRAALVSSHGLRDAAQPPGAPRHVEPDANHVARHAPMARHPAPLPVMAYACVAAR